MSTLKMIAFDPDEGFRSLQLYGVDPDVTAAAVRMVAEDDLAGHIDLNLGCPKLADCQQACAAARRYRSR
jgi:tRNA-dihydrouridine synthase